MAGNSQRKGAVRKTNKKGATKGTGGNRRKGLEGHKATPKAEDRTYHAAYKRKQERMRRDSGRQRYDSHDDRDRPELVVGRNPVVECIRAKVPATALYVVTDISADDRINEAVHMAANRGIPVLEVTRAEMDNMTGNGMHQGIGLQIPPFEYATVDSVIDSIAATATPGMVVVLDNITDPRNLGAVIRSAAAFGGNAVVIPERRSASVTAVAWRTSAGTAARLPVAKATNLVQSLKKFQQAGYQVVGLDASDEHTIDTYDGTIPVVIVVGSEGKGISRLVKETCDTIVSIPMTDWVESLNASVAAGVVLSEFARQRRIQGGK